MCDQIPGRLLSQSSWHVKLTIIHTNHLIIGAQQMPVLWLNRLTWTQSVRGKERRKEGRVGRREEREKGGKEENKKENNENSSKLPQKTRHWVPGKVVETKRVPWWIYVMTYLSKPVECTSRGTPNVNNGLRWRCRVSVGASAVTNILLCMCVCGGVLIVGRVLGEKKGAYYKSVLSAHCEPIVIPRNKVYTKP